MPRAPAEPPQEVWNEPVRGSYPNPGLLGLTGRQALETWRQRLSPPPPLYHLTGAIPTGFGSGTAEAEMPASGWLALSNGLIAGGSLAMLADIVFGCAVQTELPAGVGYTTAELSMSFVRPVRPNGKLMAGGQSIHAGRSVALSEAFVIEQDSERLVAHGTSRLSIFPPIDPLPEPPEPEPFEPPEHPTPDPYLRPAPNSTIPYETWSELSGVELLRRQLAGELPPPPIHYLTGIRPTEVGAGKVTVTMPCSEWLASPSRFLQGGTIAMLADFAMLAAVETTVEPGVALAGLDLKANYLRPVPPGEGVLTAIAEVVHSGRTIAITRATVLNAEGKPVLLAIGSSMFMPGRPTDLGELELRSGED